MNSAKKITTEEMKELVNTLNMEGEVIGYVKATKECIMMNTSDARLLEECGEGWIMPYEESLYNKTEALNRFIEKRKIKIPEGYKCWKYLRETGLNYDFDDFYDRLRLRKLKLWFKNHGIRKFKIA